ncbi:MAG: hypothetical protein JNL98_37960 [Bryobacterales bacterium]|nr:hypothetical protein [Bryobacterales bacterium]
MAVRTIPVFTERYSDAPGVDPIARLYCVPPDPESQTNETEPPEITVPCTGLVIVAGDGGARTNKTLAVRAVEPEVAVIVNGNEPAGEPDDVVTVKTLNPEPVRVCGLNKALPPTGRPATDKLTVDPEGAFTVTLYWLELPNPAVCVDGVAVTRIDGEVGGVKPAVTNLGLFIARNCGLETPARLPPKPRKLVPFGTAVTCTAIPAG